MTKREEVRLACIDRAIAAHKASGLGMTLDSEQIVRMAADYERFVVSATRTVQGRSA